VWIINRNTQKSEKVEGGGKQGDISVYAGVIKPSAVSGDFCGGITFTATKPGVQMVGKYEEIALDAAQYSCRY